MASFRNNLAARLVADTYGLATSLVAATVTARVLGPSGRGFYASLVLLSVLFAQIFNAGLGEAVTVLVGRATASFETAASATVSAVVPLSVAGALAVVLTGTLVLHPANTNDRVAIVIGGLVVLCNTFGTSIAWVLVARERIVLLAILNIVSGTTTTLLVVALVAVVDLQTSGAMLASGLGCAVILLPLLLALAREQVSLKPVWNGEYLWAAVRFGTVVQLANLLVQMTGRLDLLLVYRIAGPAPAGRYSVALTLGALVGSIPMAIAYASFPRLPRVTEDEAPVVIAGLFRTGVAASIVCAAVLGMATPVLLPAVFGSPYQSAVVPSLLLLPAGVFWSGQWILCRALAARGTPRPLFVSFSCSFLVMIVLDVVLIGPAGIGGAAAASLVSSVLGFVVATVYYLRWGGDWRRMPPRLGDAVLMLTTLREMLSAAWARGGRQVPSSAPVEVEPRA